MKSIKHAVILLLLQFTINSFGQKDYRHGYYIDCNDDTIHGLINYQDDIFNSELCVFKANEFSISVKYKPDEIKAYRFCNGKFYISKVVKPEQGGNKVFVEYLVNGEADLYYYIDNQGSHYLIEKDKGKLVELTYQKEKHYSDEKGKFVEESNKYKVQLKDVFADCKKMQHQVDKTKLKQKTLMKITENYHNCISPEERCIIYDKKFSFFSFSPILGYGVSNLIFKNHIYYSSRKFEKSLAPSFGMQINSRISRNNENIFLQLETELTKNYFYSHSEDIRKFSERYIDYHIHTTSLKTSWAIKYKFLREKIRPTVAFGVVSNYFIEDFQKGLDEQVSRTYNTVTVYESVGWDLKKIAFGLSMQIGFDYKLFNKFVMFNNLRLQYIGLLKSNYNVINLNIGLYL